MAQPFDIAPDGDGLPEILTRAGADRLNAALPAHPRYPQPGSHGPANTVLRGAHIYIEDGEIRQVGTQPARLPRADRTISGRYAVAVPGLVNTHHHLFQTLTRACPAAADAELFDWLRTLYPLWARLDKNPRRGGAGGNGGAAALGLHHHQRSPLPVPARPQPAIDAEIEAARRIGIRFHPTRGSMSVGRSKGGLPPDSVVARSTSRSSSSRRPFAEQQARAAPSK